ncbi:MAG: DUF721 domain-containing protein [Planctomycetaceae bacterium]|nr:DUF721 domain-containing protein [Planctomycetaceae bacterium]
MSPIRRDSKPSGPQRGRSASGGTRSDAGAPGENKGPRALAEILSQLNVLRGHGRSQGNRQLAELWERIAGPEISGRTKVIGLRNGALVVGVSSTALLGELTSFHSHQLLEALRGDSEGRRIKGLKFQLRSSATGSGGRST